MASNRKEIRTPDKKVQLKRMAKGSVSILLAVSLASPGTIIMTGDTKHPPISLSPMKVVAAEDNADPIADSKTTTDFTYTTYEEGGTEKASIIGYTGTDWNLTIPKTLTVDGEEIPVGKLSGFSKNENITGLTIEDGASVEIGENAFQGCPNLKTVSLPSGTTFALKEQTAGTIHYGYNFEGCTSLTELTLGDGITVLPDHIFENCTSLKSVRLPSKLDCFENSAFSGCTSLETVEIPEGVQEIGFSAFKNCTSLTQVVIPSTIQRWCITEHLEVNPPQTQFQNSAFNNCTSLAQITLTEGLTVVGSWAFDNTALTSVTVPSTVTTLNYTFYNCKKLEEVILQEGSLTEIGINTFANCEALKSIEIPPTVTTFGEAPFLNCTSLKMLVLPPSLKTFNGNSYFDKGCTLEKVFILAEEISVPTLLAFTSGTKIYCPADSETYKMYSTKLSDSQQLIALTPDMLTIDLLGVTAETYQGVYDEKGHPLATLTGQRDKEKITYRMVEGGSEIGEVLSAIPEITEPGTYEMKIAITRMGVEYCKTVQAKIEKKTPILQLEDLTVKEGENWTVSPKEYDGEGEITYTFYEDEALEKKCSGKPTAPGVYYMQATAEESAHYISVKSNGAKLEIVKTQVPPATENPSPQPQSPTPSIQPTKSPSQKVTVKKAKIKKVRSAKKKTLEVRWNKVSNATGYVIWIGQNKKFTKGKKTYTVKSGKTTKKIISKLKRKKKYFVKIRAYRVVKGKKYQGSFSSVKSCKIK